MATAPPTHEDLKIVKLYKVFCTVSQMVHDRGYTIKKPEVIATGKTGSPTHIDFATFKSLFVTTESQHPGAIGEAPQQTQADSSDEENTTIAETSAPRTARVINRDAMRITCKKSIPSPAAGAVGAAEPEGGAPPSSSSGSSSTMIVFFSEEDHVSVNAVTQLRHKAQKKKASSMLVICQSRIPASIRRDVEEFSGRVDEITGERIMFIQLMEEDALIFNIMQHETTPKHFPMTPQEAEAFLKARQLQVAQLPRMKKDDPVAQYFGLDRGCIVRIERNADYTGPYEMFRQVI